MPTLKFVRASEAQKKDPLPLPSKATPGSSGLDLSTDEDFEISGCDIVTIDTGLVAIIPEGYELQIRSRSGLASKHGIHVLNSPGTVDSDYRGPLKVILHKVKDTSDTRYPPCVKFLRGSRIAQAVLVPVVPVTVEEAYEIDNTQRGDKGFGSSGIK